MKSKLFKRTAAFTLASAMALSSAMYAMAGGTTAEPTTYKITLTDEVEPNGTYKAYQIFKGKVTNNDNELTQIEWGSGVEYSQLVTALNGATADFEGLITGWDEEDSPLFASDADAVEIAAILDENKDNAEFVDLFAKYAAKYVKNGVEFEEDGSNYTAEVDSAGYYLIKDETNIGDDQYVKSTHILKVVKDVEVTAKHSLPTVTKEITAEDGEKTDEGTTAIVAGITDVVSYSLTGTLPSNYDTFDAFYYKFGDKLPAGLTLNVLKDNKEKKYITVDVGADNTVNVYEYDNEAEEPQSYFYTYNETTGDFNVIFYNLKEFKNLTAGSTIVVKYDATVNENATIFDGNNNSGNVNRVKLSYSNDPYSDYDGYGPEDPDDPNPNDPREEPSQPDDPNTPPPNTSTTEEDDADVYVLKLTLTKVNDADKKLKGVKFTIQDKGTGKYAKAELKNGAYTITGWGTANEATEFVTNDEGNFDIKGLDTGTYVITETYRLPGYSELDPFEIEITADASETAPNSNQFELNDLAVTDDNDEDVESSIVNGVITVRVINTTGALFPETGGSGVYLYYIVGGGLVALATTALVVSKKKSKKNA